MDCQKVKELLIEHVAGGLRQEQKASVDEHLRACSGCIKEHEAILTLQSQKIADPGEAFWQELSAETLEQIRAKQTAPGKWIDRFVIFPRWAYAVGGVACFFILFMLNHYFTPKDKFVVSQSITDIPNELYREVAAEFFTTDEPSYTIWSLETVELDELADTLDVNGLIQQAVDYPLYEEDVYQLLEQLDADELEYVYQSLEERRRVS